MIFTENAGYSSRGPAPNQGSRPTGAAGGFSHTRYNQMPPGADPQLWNWFSSVDFDRSGMTRHVCVIPCRNCSVAYTYVVFIIAVSVGAVSANVSAYLTTPSSLERC